MSVEDGKLIRIAAAVADGGDVDWEVEAAAGSEVRGRIEQLRLIASIQAAHGSLPPAPIGPMARLSEMTTVDRSPSPALEAQPPPVSWGPLRIVARLGGGAWGDVYRAHDPSLQIDVALKLLREDRRQDEKGLERFLSEARRLARVRHPGVLRVFGADRHAGRVGLWTELIEGRTLEEILKVQGILGADEATMIGIDLCRALAAVHAAGLIHRDVKTSNIMREAGGRIVLMDFSASAERDPLDAARSGDTVSGTPLFMAPELFRNEDAGTASDIYSLGVVLYRLVSARFPVEAKSFAELEERHRGRESAPLRSHRPDLPAAFVTIVDRALDPDPSRRYATAGEVERDLCAAVGAHPPAEAPLPAPSWWRRPGALAALAGSALLFAAGLWALLGPLVLPSDLKVEASLYRAGEALEERLGPGAAVEPGDHLFLEILASHDVHVYVFDEDEAGSAFVLFPLPELDLGNPLPGGQRHRLPGSLHERPKHWLVSSAGGRESVLVIASREPLPALAQEIERTPKAEIGEPFEMDGRRVEETLRGIGHVADAGAPTEPGGRRTLSSVIAGISSGRSPGVGIWVWQIDLENPRQ